MLPTGAEVDARALASTRCRWGVRHQPCSIDRDLPCSAGSRWAGASGTRGNGRALRCGGRSGNPPQCRRIFSAG